MNSNIHGGLLTHDNTNLITMSDKGSKFTMLDKGSELTKRLHEKTKIQKSIFATKVFTIEDHKKLMASKEQLQFNVDEKEEA